MASFIENHENLISMLGVCADAPVPIILYSLQEGWTLKDVIEHGGQVAATPDPRHKVFAGLRCC